MPRTKPAVFLDAKASLVERFAQMGMHPDATRSCDLRGTLHQAVVTENGEHGATAICRMESGEASCHLLIASSVAAIATSVSSTTESGGRPPDDVPRSIEPRVGWKR